MALTQLAKSRWQDYFDHVSKALPTKLVEVEVAGLGLGDQVEVDWLPLLGLSYDPKDDVLTVMVEGIEHNIWHPKQIHVDQDVESLHSMEVVDAAGEHHILLLKDPLRLPPPSEGSR
ncbi:DUF5335 domain-containing protein [Nitrosovibrio tenuis]|uniref:Uncharacterized protein n=1 Tax=Nitrosovibrio tenuis TaxID=1233 RepID=A0A1H7QYD3_9PROT|nr:DUF5335 domain-containing protein [Nitrosovibrio tenuis]SEL53031.1 hypothetical protein SAMN05216387_11417 [Nitrosovibrio tenuis]